MNMSLSTTVNLQIPEEIWQGESMDNSILRIFGYPACNLVNSQKRNKLESKLKRCYFIDFTNKSVFISRDVIFVEESSCK